MYETSYTRLYTPVLCLILASLFGTIAYTGERLPDWMRYFLILLTIVLGTTGVVTMMDWMLYHTGERIREIGAARVYPAQLMAKALEGLTSSQVEAVMRFDRTEIQMLINDEKPLFTVRCLTRNVPWEFVDEFLRKSQETPGFLYPIRESGNREFATEITNLCIAKGWATHAGGPFSARLEIPLSTIAYRFGVDLNDKFD